MGIISRFADIMGANINAMLSKAEGANADKLLEKYIQDAKASLGQIKSETAAVMADEMACARKLTENDNLQRKYEGYAEAAMRAGNEADARKFLAFDAELETKRVDLDREYAAAKQNSEKMKQMTSKLMGDIEAANSKLQELKTKLNVAKQQENLNKINDKIYENPMGKADNLFDAVQKRIDTAEAAAQLNAQSSGRSEVDDLAKKYESASYTGTPSVEEKLAAMKLSMGQPIVQPISAPAQDASSTQSAADKFCPACRKLVATKFCPECGGTTV